MKKKVLTIGLICIGSLFLVLLKLEFWSSNGIFSGNTSKPKTKISVTYTPNKNSSPINEESIPDSKYHKTLQEALNDNGIIADEDEKYKYNIDEIIKSFENDHYISIFFRSVKNKDLECFTMAKFKKKMIGGQMKYTFLSSIPEESRRNGLYLGSFKENLKGGLALSDFMQGINIDPKNTRFIYGESQFKKIYHLEIEGQKPTGIITYKVFGKEWYFWYYENLESSKPGDELSISIKK